MKRLENLMWAPRWISQLGCIKGCLDHLGLNISDAWLYGGTGQAFVMNVHETVCPSGPTAWRTEILRELGRNLGYRIEGVCGCAVPETLEGLQKQAWDFVRRAIDQGHPCYGWELAVPEYYVIHGYDDDGYRFSGPARDDGLKPWRELGRSDIRMVEVCSVTKEDPAGDTTIVRSALSFACEYAENPGKWTFPKYSGGPAAYNAWIRALRGGSALEFGVAYNAAVWAECRRHAVGFLRDAAARLGGKADPALILAAGRYEIVASELEHAANLFPFSPGLTGTVAERDERTGKAIEALETAREAEVVGLDRLQDAMAQIGG